MSKFHVKTATKAHQFVEIHQIQKYRQIDDLTEKIRQIDDFFRRAGLQWYT